MKYTLLIISMISLGLGCQEGEKVALKKSDKAEKTVFELPVHSVQVETFSENLMLTGTTKPLRAVSLSPGITARVTKVLVEENAQVKKGAKLVRLDARSAVFGVQQARANAQSSQAATKQLEADYQRLLPLAKSGTIPKSRLDQLKLQLDLARSQQKAAGAAANSASNMASNGTIKAPFAATVVEIPAEVGQMAMATASVLVRLADLSVLKVAFQVKERDLNRIEVGDVVDIEFPAVEQKTTAKIASISFEINPQTRSAEVVAHVVNEERKFRSGLFAKVNIASKKAEEGIFLPNEAVQTKEGKSWVFVVENGVAKQKFVDVKLMSDNRQKITKGLTANEKVVMDKVRRISDGTPIKESVWLKKETK